MKIKKITIFIFGIILCVAIGLSAVGTALDEEKFSLDVPLQEGIKAATEHDYERAVESFRKVLFVDGTNCRAQFGLARALEKIGKKKKAIREYKLFLRIASNDTRLSAQERTDLIEKAKSAVEKLRKDSKGFLSLSFTEINILLISIVLTVTLGIKLIRYSTTIFSRGTSDEKKLTSMWTDNAWLQDKEREIRSFPIDLFTVLMIILMVYFDWMSFRILFCK
ncbi:tetratricopeptide repeat protein [Candidatus Omnitrophota bacterium]